MKNILKKIIILCSIIIFNPLFIYADDEILEETLSPKDITIETSSTIVEEPIINARYAVVFDKHSKEVIYGKKENETCKMASTTKIMTAIVVIENSKLSDIVNISKKAASTGGSRLGLSKNDRISVENLLYGLLLKSGNDTAVALAENTGGSIENFVLMMNKKAKELNLSDTNFVTPHGLDNDNHYTTAVDLALLTDYALKNEIFSKIVNTKTYTILINNQPKTISNTNELLGNYEGIYGVKTGFTNGANRCLVTSCKRDNLDFICVVLGCDTKKDRTMDTIKLLNYAFKNFTLINTKNIATKAFNEWKKFHHNSFYINKGKSHFLNLYLNESNFSFEKIAINKSEKENVCVEISFCSYFEAPCKKNTLVGTLNLYIKGKKYYSIDILNDTEIIKKNILDYLLLFFKNYSCFFTRNA